MADTTAESFLPPTGDEALSRQRLRLWVQMLKAVRFMENELRERLRMQFDMTLPRFDVLATLHSAPDGMKMSELSQQLMVSNGNVTGIVDRLAADGLVERQSHESDRRAFRVVLTEAGKALVADLLRAHRSWIDELFCDVSETDAARGIAIMMDIRHKTRRT